MTRPRALAAGLALALCVAATQAEQDQKKWDVAAPTGGSPTPLAFDTSEGTWMNLDVSPDGQADRLRPARRHLPDADRRSRRRRQSA